MIQRKFLTPHKLTLAPGQLCDLPATGSVFSCKSCTLPIVMCVDGGEEFPVDAGWSFNLAPDNFRFLQFRNVTTVPVIINFFTGSNLMSYTAPDNRQKVASTDSQGSDQINLAALGANPVPIPGNFAGHDRKQIFITNRGTNDSDTYNTNYIILMDSAGKFFGIIWPQTTWTAETNADFIIKSGPGCTTALRVVVGELYYVQ